MYESPEEIIYGQIKMQMDDEIYRAVQEMRIEVNKEELIKALQHDRGQYDKGYADGKAEAIKEFAERLIKKLFPYGMPDNGNYGINAKAVRETIYRVVKEMEVIKSDNI